MAGPSVSMSVLPTGGAVLLAFYGAQAGNFAPPSGATVLTLSRAASGASYLQIYSGAPLPFWCDAGDGPLTSSTPLDPATSYMWQAVDSGGTTTVGPVVPGGSIVTSPDSFTQLLIRLLQAGLDNAPRPAGVTVNSIQVTTKMPSGGWGTLPFAVVNLDLIQQSETMVGQDVLAPDAQNRWTLPGWARRVWRVSVLSPSADERDFYRDALLIVFRALKATLFSQVGQNIRHTFQAASGTSADEWVGLGPGFYYADVVMEIEGTFDVTIATGFGPIGAIDVTLGIEPPAEPATPVVPVGPGGVAVAFDP